MAAKHNIRFGPTLKEFEVLRETGDGLPFVFVTQEYELIVFESMMLEDKPNNTDSNYELFSGRVRFPIDGKLEAHGRYDPFNSDGWISDGSC